MCSLEWDTNSSTSSLNACTSCLRRLTSKHPTRSQFVTLSYLLSCLSLTYFLISSPGGHFVVLCIRICFDLIFCLFQQPTWRLWGEEKSDGALYTVYLKKVRYHRPTRSLSQSGHSDSEDEISHLEWETVRVRFVKAGTLKRLVEALATDDGELETTYINVFLATYRSFSTPKEVLRLLLQRYEELSAPTENGRGDQHEQHRK